MQPVGLENNLSTSYVNSVLPNVDFPIDFDALIDEATNESVRESQKNFEAAAEKMKTMAREVKETEQEKKIPQTFLGRIANNCIIL